MNYLRWGAIAAGSVMMVYAVANAGLTSQTVEVHPKIPGVPAQSLYAYSQTKYRPLVPLTGLAGFALVTVALLGMRSPQQRG